VLLFKEVHMNLTYRWFCGIDLSGRLPDLSISSKNWHGRFRESELPRHLFETIVARASRKVRSAANAWQSMPA